MGKLVWLDCLILERAMYRDGRPVSGEVEICGLMLAHNFGGVRCIAAMMHGGGDSCSVPGFGHNYLCDHGCICGTTRHGVKRDFGLLFACFEADSYEQASSALGDYPLSDEIRVTLASCPAEARHAS